MLFNHVVDVGISFRDGALTVSTLPGAPPRDTEAMHWIAKVFFLEGSLSYIRVPIPMSEFATLEGVARLRVQGDTTSICIAAAPAKGDADEASSLRAIVCFALALSCLGASFETFTRRSASGSGRCIDTIVVRRTTEDPQECLALAANAPAFSWDI